MIVGIPFTDLPNVMVVQKGEDFRTEEMALPGLDRLPPRKLEVWARDAIPFSEATNVIATGLQIVRVDGIYRADIRKDVDSIRMAEC